jgi:Domain of unknown function (DUF4375)
VILQVRFFWRSTRSPDSNVGEKHSVVEAIRLAAADFSDEVLEKLEPFDQEFFSYPHNLTELLFAYVSQHPQEFGDLPRPDDA